MTTHPHLQFLSQPPHPLIMSNNKNNVPTGYANEIVISDSTFRSAHRGIISASQPKKRKREEKGDSGVVHGPNAYKGPWARFKEKTPEVSSGSEEEIEVTDSEGEEEAPPLNMATDYADEILEDSTEFNGSNEKDYLGRTYMHIPPELRGDVDDIKNYVPKKISHTFKDQQGAPLTQIRFFPSSGHLLLTASASGKVKLFDMLNKDGHKRELLRTYTGHNKSANDIDFSNDGIDFLTASYDRNMKLWDTETGQCKAKFSTGKTPHVIRFNPGNNNEFLVGTVDKKIVQFDVRTREIIQEYEHHLGPVNTITFCDENRRFVTTSDDRSLRAWEYGIPVPIKLISEPDMFSMNRSYSHPTKDAAIFQSSDNQITVYSTGEKFRQNRKKGFRGHSNAGYAIDCAISPDGELVMSGDTGGYLCFWDWKTSKLLQKLENGSSPVLAARFSPREVSEAVTGDRDGIIRIWK
jgi:pre-mRNA-processing factor 17